MVTRASGAGEGVYAPQVAGETTTSASGGFSGAVTLPKGSKFVQGAQPDGVGLLSQGRGPDASRQLAPNAQGVLGPSCGVPDVPVEKYNNGNIRAEIYRGPDLPRGSYVRYYTSGKPAKIVFANETTFQGIQFSRGDYAEIDERTGKITKIATNHPVKIGEYTLAPVFRTDGSCGGFEKGIVFATNQDHGNVQFVELENGKLKKGVLAVGGIYGDTLELPAGTLVKFDSKGRLLDAEFLLPQTVGELSVLQVKFDQRGRLSEALLAEDMPVGRNSIVFKAGTWVRFGEDGEPSDGFLAFSEDINFIPCDGDAYVSLYPDSSLSRCRASENFTYGGIECAGGSDQEASLHDNLRLYSCILDGQQSFRIPGMSKAVEFKPGTAFILDEAGRVIAGTLMPGQRIYGVKLEGEVKVDQKGVSGYLAEDATVDGVALLEGSWVQLSPAGKLLGLKVDRPQNVRGVRVEAGEYYEFDKKGRPWRVDNFV